MKYSFLLVNYNMGALVRNAVHAVEKESCAHSSWEFIIADNSTDSAHRLSPKHFANPARVRLVPLRENRGFVHALNEIIPLATGDYVIIMHPDVEMRKDCLQALTSFMDHHPEAGVVSPDLYYPNGVGCRIRLRFPSISTEFRRCLNTISHIILRKRLMRDEIFWDRSSDVTVDMVMSVFMMFRRKTLQEIGRLDPRLTMYYSNDYLCGRARELGWTCHYIRQAQVIHFERYTPKQHYSDQPDMEYKRSTIAANPQMRSDYFVFLSIFYSLWERLGFRCLAAMQDMIQLMAHFGRRRERKSEMADLMRSLAVDACLSRT